jgi:LysR family transcriptional regulator for bpeEF and oprC
VASSLPYKALRYDQLAAMRAFARVVEAGNFTRAADSLGMPKPTVTKLIQALETHLRTKLLNRTTRRVILTSDGAAYYERALRILTDLDELDGSMSLSQASPKGRLRIDVSPALANLVIIPALPAFHQRYPDIQIDLGATDRAVNLISENVDCVIRGGEIVDQSLVARLVGDMKFFTCAAPAYLDRYGEPRHPSELESAHHGVGYFSAGTGRFYPFDFTSGGETLEIRPRYVIAVNEGTAYLTAGLAGLGIMQAPEFIVCDHIKSGVLRPVLADWSAGTVPLHVVYPPNRHLSNKVRVFVDWIAALFGGHEFLRRRAT